MKTAFTFKEASHYLGVSPDTLRALIQRHEIQGRPNPNDQRSTLYEAKDIELLRVQFNRAQNASFITILDYDLAEETCFTIARDLATFLERKIGLIIIPADGPTKTNLRKLPTKPKRSNRRIDKYILSPGEPQTRWHNHSHNSKKLFDWMNELRGHYEKIVIMVASRSPFADLVTQISSSVSIVLNEFTHNEVKQVCNNLVYEISWSNQLRHGFGARFDAVILAGLTTKHRPIQQKIRKLTPAGVLVTMEANAPHELLNFWYARNSKGRP